MPNLLFIGAGNAITFYDGNNGSRAYDRTTKQLISEAERGPNHVRISSYIEDQNTIGLIGIQWGSSHNQIVLDRYDKDGNILETNMESPPEGISISSNLLKTNNNVDFFITAYDGNIFSKKDLSFINSLNGSYRDIIINQDGNRIYGITGSRTVEIIEYPSLNKLDIIQLEDVAYRGFIDEDKLVLVYFINNRYIYMSKLDI